MIDTRSTLKTVRVYRLIAISRYKNINDDFNHYCSAILFDRPVTCNVKERRVFPARHRGDPYRILLRQRRIIMEKNMYTYDIL